MATKQQLIESITKLLVEEFEPHLVTDQDRVFMEQQSVTWLDQKLKQLMADATVQRQHRQKVEETIQSIEALQAAKARLAKVQTERENDYIQFQVEHALATLPQRQAEAERQLAHDKLTFADAAKALRRFGMTEANLNVVRQILGPGFTQYDLSQALASNSLQLSAPSQEELEQWAAEDIERRNRELLTLAETSPDQLKARVRQEVEQARVATAQAEADRQFAASQERDSYARYPKLPDIWNGQALDAAFIKNCSIETHKLLTKRFGAAQLTARLQGRS